MIEFKFKRDHGKKNNFLYLVIFMFFVFSFSSVNSSTFNYTIKTADEINSEISEEDYDWVIYNPGSIYNSFISPGMWGYGQVGDFYLNLYNKTLNNTYMRYLDFLGNWYLKNSTLERNKSKWITYINYGSPKYSNYSGYNLGVAGAAYFLIKLSNYTTNLTYFELAQNATNYLMDTVNSTNGYHWLASETSSEYYTGKGAGTAGIGELFIIMYNITKDSFYLDSAISCANWLINVSNNTTYGINWPHKVYSGQKYNILGNDHGVLGITNFFLDLYYLTKHEIYKDYIFGGAEWIINITLKGDNNYYWKNQYPFTSGSYYNFTGGNGLSGVGKFFNRLYRLTGDSIYLQYSEGAAHSLIDYAIQNETGKRWYTYYDGVTPSYKTKIGLGTGMAEIFEFFMDLYNITSNQTYLEYAKHAAEYIMYSAQVNDLNSYEANILERAGSALAFLRYNADNDMDNLDIWDEILVYGTDPNNPDTDSDGLNDYKEAIIHGTSPINNDTDDDGLNDYLEIFYGYSPFSNDTDSDGVIDSVEVLYNSDGRKKDTDNDGLSDYEEIYIYKTSPTSPDSDGDTFSDYFEVVWNLDPNSEDTDGEGLNDTYEYYTSLTDPRVADTDGDGLDDYEELFIYNTSPLDSDSDNDGLNDFEEIQKGTDPNNPDTDGDGIIDGADENPLESITFYQKNESIFNFLIGIGLGSLVALAMYFKPDKSKPKVKKSKKEEKVEAEKKSGLFDR